MINFKKIGSISFLKCLFLIISLSGCNELLDKIIVPRSAVLSIYKSPKFDNYKIKTISLIPMSPDDTTDQGTFYSTNHFLNKLKGKFPNVLFTIPKVDSIMAFDSLAIVKIIDSIEKMRRLDLKYFFDSDLGYAVDEHTSDAMFIGTINKIIYKKGYSSGRGVFKPMYATLTSCQFTYYLISLKDGRVLWKVQLLGEEGYFINSKNIIYPPLDYAVSNGIDIVIDKIPLTDSKPE